MLMPRVRQQGTYHQDGSVTVSPHTDDGSPAALVLLSNLLRARILHTLALQDDPIQTTTLSQASGVAYRRTIAHLHDLEQAGAVVADIPPDEVRQGREIRWSISQGWVDQALDDITTYLAPRT